MLTTITSKGQRSQSLIAGCVSRGQRSGCVSRGQVIYRGQRSGCVSRGQRSDLEAELPLAEGRGPVAPTEPGLGAPRPLGVQGAAVQRPPLEAAQLVRRQEAGGGDRLGVGRVVEVIVLPELEREEIGLARSGLARSGVN